MFGEHGDDTAFGGDVEAAQSRVEVEHVRFVANRCAREHVLGLEVENEQRGIAVAGDERKPPRRIEVEPVVVLTARQRVAPSNPFSFRVDHDQLVSGLHVDQDSPGAGVVLDVAGPAADVNRTEPPAATSLGDDHRGTRFVRDEHLLLDRVASDPVRIATGRDATNDRGGSFVERHQFVRVRGGGEDPPDARGDQDAMHAWQAGDRRTHAPALDVEDDRCAGGEMRDVEPVPARIERLIVEARAAARQRDVRDQPERQLPG